MLDVQIAHAGMDQRKVHMLARELSHSYKKEFAAIHHHLLPGLQINKPTLVSVTHIRDKHAPHTPVSPETSGPPVPNERTKEEEVLEKKMSKSIPGSAIFIHDSEDEIKNKISKAYCPPKIVEGNPIVEYAEYLVMRERGLKVERPAKYGGDVDFATAEELKSAFWEGKLSPVDLKNAVARELVEILRPSREYFEKNRHYLEQIREKDITR